MRLCCTSYWPMMVLTPTPSLWSVWNWEMLPQQQICKVCWYGKYVVHIHLNIEYIVLEICNLLWKSQIWKIKYIHIVLVPCSQVQESDGITRCTVRHQQVSRYVVTWGRCKWSCACSVPAYPVTWWNLLFMCACSSPLMLLIQGNSIKAFETAAIDNDG